MKPLTIITGIVLGSSGAVAVGLLVVMLIFVLTGLDQPRISDEFGPLASSVGMFSVLTVISALSFVGLLRDRAWRWYAQVAMWATVLVIGYSYWPS